MNRLIKYEKEDDGWAWYIEINGTRIVRSVRTYLELQDARLHADYWLFNLGLSVSDLEPLRNLNNE